MAEAGELERGQCPAGFADGETEKEGRVWVPLTLRKPDDPHLPTSTNSTRLKLRVAKCFRASPPTATRPETR